jgi:hypothetical protein
MLFIALWYEIFNVYAHWLPLIRISTINKNNRIQSNKWWTLCMNSFFVYYQTSREWNNLKAGFVSAPVCVFRVPILLLFFLLVWFGLNRVYNNEINKRDTTYYLCDITNAIVRWWYKYIDIQLYIFRRGANRRGSRNFAITLLFRK